MSYDDLCHLLNNLSHVVIPFDKTEPTYIDMISALRRHLKHSAIPLKYYEVVEAVIKLQVEESTGIKELMRGRVKEGRWSRNAYDISICLHWFGSSYRVWKNGKDLEAFWKVFKDVKFMQVDTLRS